VARRARKDLDVVQEKRAKVVELRSRGLTWEAIAAAVGYSGPSAASKAWYAAIRQRPDMTVDQVREDGKARLEYVTAKAAEQIENPGPRVSAIGKLAVWPAGHPKAGQIVEDESVRSRAMDTYRKSVADYVKLCGAYPETGLSKEEADRQYETYMTPIRAQRAAEASEVTELRAELSRYRALTAFIPQAGDDDITDAEVVDP
jgi:hypothetical protein